MRETAVPDVTGFIYSAGFLLGLHSVFRSGTRYFSLPASLQHSLLSFHAGRKSADISGTYTLQIALWRHARAPVRVCMYVCARAPVTVSGVSELQVPVRQAVNV